MLLKSLVVVELCFAVLLFSFAIYIAYDANWKLDDDSIFGVTVFVIGSAISVLCAGGLRQSLLLKYASQIVFFLVIIFFYLYMFTTILVF